MNKKIIFLTRALYSVFFVIITRASMTCAMESELAEDYVTIMIADAQNPRGILKRAGSKNSTKKVVRWAEPKSVATEQTPEQQIEQKDEQKDESKSQEKEPGNLSSSESQSPRGRQGIHPWHLQGARLVNELLSESEQAEFCGVGWQKHQFFQAFFELWPTQELFRASAALVGDWGDNSDNNEAVKNNLQALLLAALAAQKNKKNDQLLEAINSKRAQLKPYGYVKWPFAIMGVCFCVIIAGHYWCMMRG